MALRYGVSRQPAREALIALAKIGLVRVLPQSGTVVVKISTRQMMQVRFTEALERQSSAGLSSVSIHDPRQPRAMIAAQRQAALDEDRASFEKHDERFHAALATGADAELAWRAVTQRQVPHGPLVST